MEKYKIAFQPSNGTSPQSITLTAKVLLKLKHLQEQDAFDVFGDINKFQANLYGAFDDNKTEEALKDHLTEDATLFRLLKEALRE